MRLRSLSVALLAGIVLVPVSTQPALAVDAVTAPTVTGAGKTFKSSSAKRAKMLARTAAAPAASGGLSTPTTGPVATTVTYSDRVLALTNNERTSRGLRALAFSSCADGYANSWAKALSVAGALSHQALTPILTNCRARSVGENVAYGNVTPEQLVKMWMDSPGHRANILNPGFTHLGVGDVKTSTGRVYAVQVFLTL